jgi:DNA-binding PucR family transcriptional regulator
MVAQACGSWKVRRAPLAVRDDARVLDARLADELDRNLSEWLDSVLDRVAAEVPPLVEDEQRAMLARESSRGLLTEFASALRIGGLGEGFRAPAAALEFARHLARRNVPLAGLLRAYRLGQELLFSRAAELGIETGDTEGVARIGVLTFRYVDRVVAEVAEAFENEREAFLRGSLARRERLVRDLLAGGELDLAAAELTLGRRFDGAHLALVAWRPEGGSDPDLLASALRPLVGALGHGRPLTVFGVSGDVFVWTTPRTGDLRRIDRGLIEPLRAAGIRVAVGLPASGVSGFIASRRQADAARRVARERPDVVVVNYADVALLDLLLRDRAAAAAFAREQLGELARPDPRASELRSTLATYLSAGRDASATASALGVHRNTVARRLTRAEQLIGRPLDRRTDELIVALTIAQATVT